MKKQIKEHDGCDKCKYFSRNEKEFPCKNCNANYIQPNGYADLWEENIEVQELPNPIRPNHYKSCSIECIDAMILTFGSDAVALFCQINAFKYIWRHKDKNREEDINKANWYVLKAIELNGVNDTIDYLSILINKSKGEYDGMES